MDRAYDLYERMSDGSLTWRGFARGAEKARRRLHSLNLETGHECFGVYLPTKEVIAVSRPNDAKR
jgi:hypothetical protein